jgi:hypothetical protein
MRATGFVAIFATMKKPALSILFKESVLIYFMMTLWLIAAANIVSVIVLILCVLIL